MTWIEPLEMETWIINVFSGSYEIFTAIALIVLFSMAGYFRMAGLTMLLMVVLFLTMFAGYVDKSFLFLIISLGGLMIGYWISKIVDK